jgi:DNA end-binding protein Ku
MRSINKIDIELGEQEIPISVYSVVEKDVGFKQFSKCCEDSVAYKKSCKSCNKELESSDIFKGIELNDEIKKVETEKLKVDSYFKILGICDFDFENGFIPNGNSYYFGFQKDKSKRKEERNILKFSYIRESLRESGKKFIGLISLRGKEQLVLIVPYFDVLLGVGINFFENVRDIKEIVGKVDLDNIVVKDIAKKICEKEVIYLKDVANKRNELIEEMILDEKVEKVEKVEKESNDIEVFANGI